MSTTTSIPQLSTLNSQLSTAEAAPRAPSALRQLRTLFHRLVEPQTIEDAYGHDLFTEHTAGLALASTSAARTEGLVERLRRHCTEFFADGKLTPPERRILAQDQRALAQAAHQTTEQLEQLR